MKKPLLITQTDQKLRDFKALDKVSVPQEGWLKTVRTSIGMSLRQFGHRLGITAQSAKELEAREASGSITLNSLREAGNAMNLKLVYGFVPRDGSLEAMVEQRALQMAAEIVNRTAHSMMLELQEPSAAYLSKALKSKAAEISEKMPRYLWD